MGSDCICSWSLLIFLLIIHFTHSLHENLCKKKNWFMIYIVIVDKRQSVTHLRIQNSMIRGKLGDELYPSINVQSLITKTAHVINQMFSRQRHPCFKTGRRATS